jgi:phosphoserine phosphatase
VSTLKGVPVSVFQDVLSDVVLSPGAAELVAECHRRGWTFGLISGGFHEIVDPIAARYGVEHVRANRLEIADGVLTGRIVGEIVDGEVKARTLREWAAAEAIPLTDCVAIGDGANDMLMMQAAGTGVAYRAKPVVREAAPHAIDGNLMDVFALLD